MAEPIFISNDPSQILADMVQQYQAITGRILQPAQVERLVIGAMAYRESMLRAQIQAAAVQNLVDYATAPALDLLGQLVGVTRLQSAGASTTIVFTLVSGHTGIVIPENTRIGTADGKVFFATVESVTVAPGVTSAQVEAYAEPVGIVGNGYAIGEVKNILDPLPYLLAASNQAITAGGSDTETDERLRERIKLAPAAFSTAGSRGAYVHHTKAVSPLIIDVAVLQPTPGTVAVYPLVAGGVVTPGSLLSQVLGALNDETVRPLTDTVTVLSPTVTNYTIEVEIVAYTGQDLVQLQADVTASVNAYKEGKETRLGQDVTIDQVIAAALLQGRVYGVNVVEPAADVVVGPTAVAKCGGVTVTITSTTNG